jgi:hypothetical protein
MHRSRLLAPFLVAAALLIPTASVDATPPVGSCAPSFTAIDYPTLIARFPALIDVFGADAISAQFDIVDANDDGLICYRDHPSWSTSYMAHTLLINIVDDNARSGPH